MVAISWAALVIRPGPRDRQWRPIWALRNSSRNTAQTLPSCSSCKSASWKCAHLLTEGTGGWEFHCRSVNSPGNIKRAIAPAWRMRAAHWCTLFSVDHGRDPWSTVVTSGKKETIAWCPCTPPAKLETFSEKSALQLVPVRRKRV